VRDEEREKRKRTEREKREREERNKTLKDEIRTHQQIFDVIT
jgi:hypothetical protein